MVTLNLIRDDAGWYIPGILGHKIRLGSNVYLDVLDKKFIKIRVAKRRRWFQKPFLCLHKAPFGECFYMAGLDTSFLLPTYVLNWKRTPRNLYLYEV